MTTKCLPKRQDLKKKQRLELSILYSYYLFGHACQFCLVMHFNFNLYSCPFHLLSKDFPSLMSRKMIFYGCFFFKSCLFGRHFVVIRCSVLIPTRLNMKLFSLCRLPVLRTITFGFSILLVKTNLTNGQCSQNCTQPWFQTLYKFCHHQTLCICPFQT
jgi:hypothetical protein